MNAQFNVEEELTAVTCCSCFVVFAMPERMRAKRSNEGGDFYCPNGHCQHFRKSRVQELEEQLAREKQLREKADQARSAAVTREQAELEQRLAAEANLARLKKRIKSGVCPCCKRSFRNVKDHIAHKHPGFIPEKK